MMVDSVRILYYSDIVHSQEARLDCAFDMRVRHIGSDTENSGTSMDNRDYQPARHGDLIEAGTLYVALHS